MDSIVSWEQSLAGWREVKVCVYCGSYPPEGLTLPGGMCYFTLLSPRTTTARC